MIDGKLKKHLKFYEGEVKEDGRHMPYTCPAGYLTIGWGRNLERGISDDEAEYLLNNDIKDMKAELVAKWPWIESIDKVRFECFVRLAFNLGVPVLSQFKNTLAAAKICDWDKCADELIDSRWYRQVGSRGDDIVAEIRTGVYQ